MDPFSRPSGLAVSTVPLESRALEDGSDREVER